MDSWDISSPPTMKPIASKSVLSKSYSTDINNKNGLAQDSFLACTQGAKPKAAVGTMSLLPSRSGSLVEFHDVCIMKFFPHPSFQIKVMIEIKD